MLSVSNIISIIYFAANILLLLALALYIKKTGEHKSIKSTLFLKDLWSQRKIYAPIIVHFYDTATDIGVLYYWYTLMKDEQEYGGEYYQSVNMKSFFWTGIAFLILYRAATVVFLAFATGCSCSDRYLYWFDYILSILDLLILRMVYISAKEAQVTIAKNIQKRKKKKEQKETEKQVEMQIKNSEETADIEQPQKEVQYYDPEDENEEGCYRSQMIAQTIEATVESMPQIILQSVFAIRSANEDKLKGGNIILIFLSIVASLISVANKFVFFDKDEALFAEPAGSLKPRKTFPGCIQYWFLFAVLWRVCDIMSNFAIYVLIWTVLGGAFLPIYAATIFILWIPVIMYAFNTSLGGAFAYTFVFMVGLIPEHSYYAMNVAKYILNVIGLTLVMIFATTTFDCGICADPSLRQFSNENNNRILMFFIMGCASLGIEIVLYIILNVNNLFKDQKWKY
eukprot:38476_1